MELMPSMQLAVRNAGVDMAPERRLGTEGSCTPGDRSGLGSATRAARPPLSHLRRHLAT